MHSPGSCIPSRSIAAAASLLLLVVTACRDRRTGDEAAGDVDHAQSVTAIAEASGDDTVRAAASAIRQRRPWDATLLLHRRVAGARAASATPEVAVLAAEAAAAWGGWDEAARILGAARWRGTALAGEGHELLARQAFVRNDAGAAAAHADSALRAARGDGARGIRTALLARALDRAGQRDSAAAMYARAARLAPAAGDWLLLRSAGVQADPRARERLYRDVKTPVARARIPWTEALALEQGGERVRAASLYDSLGARPQALQLRLRAAAEGPEALASLRAAAIGVLERPRSFDEWRRMLAIVDSSFSPRTAAEELRIARGSSRSGTASQTVTSYTRAAAGGVRLTDQDQYSFAMALAGIGRWRDAAAHYARVGSSSSLAGRAAYQHARALLRAGNGSASRTALRAVVSRRGTEVAAAAPALYLLADLATDEGRDAAARSAWREVATRYPGSSLASAAAFRAALISFVNGDLRRAATEFDDAARRWPNGDEATAARYWAGRALARLGDTAAAGTRWRAILSSTPTSYYAMLAARRLGTEPWSPPAAADAPPASPTVDSAIVRIAILDSLGMDVELGHERAALLQRVDGDRDALLAAGHAFRAMGESSRAIALGLKAANAGARDARTYRLIYPLLHREALIAAARRAKLDPPLVAALVRQESSFNPRAVSPVGARGLMQLMPAVGRSIARSRNYPLWDDALLLQPTVSFDLGTAHLAGDLGRHGDLTRALAAYNAGESRVTRWARKRGVADPEVFAERIPYTETRDYVRIVQRNVEMYEALYDWK